MVRKTEMVNEAKENTVVKWQEREKAETEKASRQEAKVEKGKGANWGLGSAGGRWQVAGGRQDRAGRSQ
jgi:hypothetical protein